MEVTTNKTQRVGGVCIYDRSLHRHVQQSQYNYRTINLSENSVGFII